MVDRNPPTDTCQDGCCDSYHLPAATGPLAEDDYNRRQAEAVRQLNARRVVRQSSGQIDDTVQAKQAVNKAFNL